MIPAYKEDVTITIVEKQQEVENLEQKVQRLEERVRQMFETVQYMERERSRLKGEVDTIKHQLNKK
jgi:predicted RNase H-like nuclease (RuvC/YqgF family)